MAKWVTDGDKGRGGGGYKAHRREYRKHEPKERSLCDGCPQEEQEYCPQCLRPTKGVGGDES